MSASNRAISLKQFVEETKPKNPKDEPTWTFNEVVGKLYDDGYALVPCQYEQVSLAQLAHMNPSAYTAVLTVDGMYTHERVLPWPPVDTVRIPTMAKSPVSWFGGGDPTVPNMVMGVRTFRRTGKVKKDGPVYRVEYEEVS
jgi:hypothetical protein